MRKIRIALYALFGVDVAFLVFYWLGRINPSTADSQLGMFATKLYPKLDPYPLLLAVGLALVWLVVGMFPKKSKPKAKPPVKGAPEEGEAEPGEDELDEDEDLDEIDDEEDLDEKVEEGGTGDEPEPKSKPKKKGRGGIGTTELLLIGLIVLALVIGLSGGKSPISNLGVFSQGTPGTNQVVPSQGNGDTLVQTSPDLITRVTENPIILILFAVVLGVAVWFYQRRTSFTVTWVTNVGEDPQMPLEITMRVIYYRTISGILNYIQLTRSNRPSQDVEDVEIDEADESEAVLWVTAVVRSSTDRLMAGFQPKGIRGKQRGAAEARILATLQKSKRLQSFGMAVSQVVIEDVNDIEEVEETQAQAASAEMEGSARAAAANSTVKGIQARRKDAQEEPLSGVQAWVIEVITVAGEAVRDIVAEAVTGKSSFERPAEPSKTKPKGGKSR